MLDFAKLRARTPAEREADDLQRHAEEIAADRARRRARCEKGLTLTLTLDAELRYTVGGGGVIHLRGWDERARTIAAIWYMPDDFERARVRDIFNRLREGTGVRLNGYWRSRSFSGNRVFEFIAQYLAIGDEARIP